MVRKTTLAIVMALAMLAGIIILPQTARAISLKQNSVVTGDTITLGDVFQGLSENHDKVLGIAPRPGQEMTLNARTLLRIAVALDLPWRPATSYDHIVLSRAATIVDRSMIESALRAKIDERGIDGKYQLYIPASMDNIVLSPDIAPGVEITGFEINPDTGWFVAEAVAPSAAEPVQRVKINGSVQKVIDVPVLRKALPPGTIINQRDIDFIEMKESDVRPDMLVNADALVGMTPRRLGLPGKPLKALDVESPQLIERGDIITMLFEQGGLTLTASGKALQNGAKGDFIRVLNQNSNKTIEGFVTASKEVTVKSF